jgi:hypothetical protein
MKGRTSLTHPYRFYIGMSDSEEIKYIREIIDALETGMASQHPSLNFLDPLSFHPDQAQVHLQQHVLHSEIRRHASNRDDFFLLAFGRSISRRREAQCSRFV